MSWVKVSSLDIMQTFHLGDADIEVIVGDITDEHTDAIVNAANKYLAPGGGVAGAIHRAAGPQLWEECKTLGGCQTGEAKITSGYNLPASYVIHTVGPVYSGKSQDARLLASCYIQVMRLAADYGLKSIAFPALSTGAFGYPMEKAAGIAIQSLQDVLKKPTSVHHVRFVLYDAYSLQVHVTVFQRTISKN